MALSKMGEKRQRKWREAWVRKRKENEEIGETSF